MGERKLKIKNSKFKMDGGWVLLLLLVSVGCEQVDPKQGYTNRNLYRTDVKTVFVEMFESESFRRGVEYELTHALVGQLELHTPYKVVSDRRKADTILYGSINRITERRLARQRELDRPIANEVVLVATFSWKDLRSADMLIEDKKVRVSGDYIAFLGSGSDSAAREAANDMAVRIVEAMEEKW
jgi:lipopolysaccharide assembly LptE-like protein